MNTEIEKNFASFQKMLPSLPRDKGGKFALMRDEKIIEFFDTMADAMKAAKLIYSDNIFSIQKVSNEIIDLGFFSRAVPH